MLKLKRIEGRIMEPIVKLENVSKCFEKDKYVVKDINLEVKEGEFLTLLGSSGCGKTTILRMISGLEHVSVGKVYIDGVDVTELDPTKREVNTIFQNFALFPHMTVYDNIAFGLKMKHVSKDEIDKRVKKIIKLVELEGLENRLPSEISGGQQQRVAIARGIIMNPKVLLLDESLCSLDLKLKRQMQIELKKNKKRLGITFIYVTHDQDEALTMSDRIVILNHGIIEQDDTPQNIYRYPKTVFVADFIGESNIWPGIISNINKEIIGVKISDNIEFAVSKKDLDKVGDKINILIRPENIKVSSNTLKNSIEGTVKDIIYDGAISKLFIEVIDNKIFKVNTHGIVNFKENDKVFIQIEDDDIIPIRGKKHEEK